MLRDFLQRKAKEVGTFGPQEIQRSGRQTVNVGRRRAKTSRRILAKPGK